MTTFLYGIATSLVAGTLLLLGVALFRRWRLALLWAVSRVTGSDVEYVFCNGSSARSDIEAYVRKAKQFDILSSRGNELQRGTFSSVFLDRPERRPLKVRVLLPETSLPENIYDWVAQREHELEQFDPAFGSKLLHKEIETNVAFLSPHVRSKKIELRLFNAPHIGRVILVDGRAFYTPYKSDSHGRDCPVFKFRPGGIMSSNLQRMFDQLWESLPPFVP